MTDNKYTDEEIMEALANCAFDALDFMNRQKSEIERLHKEANLVSIQFQDEQERAEEYRLKIENLQNVIFNQQIEISAKIEKQIKTEGYKEFADMVKKNIKEVWNYDNGTCSCVLVLTKDIDKILKEMVGE